MAYNRVRVTGTDLNKVREYILLRPKQIRDQTAEVLREIAAQGVRDMRNTIETSSTPTGLARGTNGRVDTGKMRDRVDQAISVNSKSVSMRFGWLNGVPGYSIYQEMGTRYISAMNALSDAKLRADISLQAYLGSL